MELAGAQRTPDPAVVWHDLECGAYAADLPLWRRLARAAGGPVLDVGAGTGRVALDLARAGHEVVALDRDPALLAALEERADGLPVRAVAGDARDFELHRRFALVLAPMQLVQLLGGREGRAAFLACARRHLEDSGRLAAALAEGLSSFGPGDRLPAPDVAHRDGWTWRSHPVAVRDEGSRVAIERIRERVDPDGRRSAEGDVVHLDAEPPCRIEPTSEHVGSRVAVLRARAPARG